jgi:hypothetical protein
MAVSKRASGWTGILGTMAFLVFSMGGPLPAAGSAGHAVPKEHPRLLGSRKYLQSLEASRCRRPRGWRGSGNPPKSLRIDSTVLGILVLCTYRTL